LPVAVASSNTTGTETIQKWIVFCVTATL
jgi:hypothetical protein